MVILQKEKNTITVSQEIGSREISSGLDKMKALQEMISDDKYLTMAKVESKKIPVEMLSDEQIKRYFHYGRKLGELWDFKSKVSPEQWNRIILLINKI